MMFGVSSMTTELRKVAVKKPGPAMKKADAALWHYGNEFDPDKVEAVHAAFVHALENFGAEVYWMGKDDHGNADAVFTYDASLMTPAGAILMSPGKALRADEQDLHRIFYMKHDIPIIGEIRNKARAEAGDTLWLDDKTLIIGRGFRTNQAGVDQIVNILRPIGIECHVFDLPYYQGQDVCLHLMSLISLVDTYKALVYLPLLPVGLWKLLLSKGFTLINAPSSEFKDSHTLNTNVLALAPGKCIMIDGFPQTRTALEDAGIDVQVFDGAALCIGCEGGPTCLTRPLLRSPS
ncbi:MAG: amidinotransferase [Aestuariivita sp.]|nr:amidinotransferase [Aestuariivita sp.]|tara:strand:- start:714 stop:1589 length:876 start_codon:yes stop_codon:yes gene_type:complete